MNRFSEELRIIPRTVWVLGLLCAGAGLAFLWLRWIPNDPFMGKWPKAGKIAFTVWPTLFLFSMVLLIGYVYADARRRGMRHKMWTFLVIFIPNGIGFILYFILRGPLLIYCPNCSVPGRAGFVFCPRCGTELAPSCPACRRAVEPGWNRCVYCGKSLDQAGSYQTSEIG
jgi:hypothetical protein